MQKSILHCGKNAFLMMVFKYEQGNRSKRADSMVRYQLRYSAIAEAGFEPATPISLSEVSLFYGTCWC